MTDKLEQIMIIGSEIDSMVDEMNIDYIEACLMYCEKYEIEVESLGDVIKNHQKMVSNLRREAEDLHYIEKTTAAQIEFE